MTIVYQPSKSYIKIPRLYSTILYYTNICIIRMYIKHISYLYLKIYSTLLYKNKIKLFIDKINK